MTNGRLTIEEVFDTMQESIDSWEGGLKASGGAIRPDKSFVYPVDFKFDSSGKYSYKKIDEIDKML